VTVDVVGVHPVAEAPEPCVLVEVRVTGAGTLDIGAITQPVDGLRKADWQVAYDAYQLSSDGTAVSELDGTSIDVRGEARLAFFFHYLALDDALQTPVGPVPLPAPTARPARLRFIAYEPPA